jgi:hypothetical protein
VFSSDLPGVNPATLNGMILYYRLMTKWSGLGDSTELSRMGLSQRSYLSWLIYHLVILFKILRREDRDNIRIIWYQSHRCHGRIFLP